MYLRCSLKLSDYSRDQLKNIGKKDAITIHSDDVPTSKVSVNGPMRDQIWFKSEAKLRRVHEPAKIVPNRYRDFFCKYPLNYGNL